MMRPNLTATAAAPGSITQKLDRETAYQQFRTGLTFAEVWQTLKAECDAGTRRHVTRHTVLGRWHQIKLAMFAEYEEYFQ